MISTTRKTTPWSALLLAGSFALGGCGQPEGDASIGSYGSALVSPPTLIATGTLATATDFSPFDEVLESGVRQNILGGIGSGLAWVGGSTFIGLPDRGPNATSYVGGAPIDNTTSFIPRLETLDLALAPSAPGSPLPLTLTPSLQGTTLLYSGTPLTYGSTPGLPGAVPAGNGPDRYYFSGRSDNFGAGLSTNPDFARLDPECIRVSRDGRSVFIADEYGPYVYQFDRETGRRTRVYALPERFAVPRLNAVGALEISGNVVGRVTNKGIEGLAITPDGSTLVALVQSPLLQDGGDGGRANRIVTIDVATGATKEYVYDNQINGKAYNSSEILALNDHQFLIDTRDGKGLGDGSTAVVKQLWLVDIAGAQDVGSLSGAAALLARAVPKVLFLDLVAALNANGIASNQIPAKIEGLAFGNDVVLGGAVTHTLFVANDNDFVPAVAGPNRWYVFGFTDAFLASLNLNASFVQQQIDARTVFGADYLSVGDTVNLDGCEVGTNSHLWMGDGDQLRGNVYAGGAVISGDGASFVGGVTTAMGFFPGSGVSVSGAIAQSAVPSIAIPTRQVNFDPIAYEVVPSQTTTTLAPGAYGAKHFQGAATINLRSGVYDFRKLTFGPDDVINVDASAGPVEINVGFLLSFDDRVRINISGGSPRDVRFYSNTLDLVYTGADSVLAGTFTVPYGQLWTGVGSSLTGRVAASVLVVLDRSTIRCIAP